MFLALGGRDSGCDCGDMKKKKEKTKCIYLTGENKSRFDFEKKTRLRCGC